MDCDYSGHDNYNKEKNLEFYFKDHAKNKKDSYHYETFGYHNDCKNHKKNEQLKNSVIKSNNKNNHNNNDKYNENNIKERLVLSAFLVGDRAYTYT